MKPTLIDQPYGTPVSQIIKTFENDKPLSADQINFLAMHEHVLSSYAFDSVIRYYLKGYRDKRKKELTFSLTEKALTKPAVQHIKQYVQSLLHSHITHVDLDMTLKQFQHFKAIGIQELIFWHGNQFLTNAPFYPGGIPYVIYFQWGNLFGIVTLQFTKENILTGKVLVHFEERQHRTLYQCIKDYSHQMKVELKPQNQPIEAKREEDKIILKPSLIKTPFFHEIH